MQLGCEPNHMNVSFDLTNLERYSLPWVLKFKDQEDCEPLNSSSNKYIHDGKLWISANYSHCGIKAYEEGDKIAFEQTIVIEYGTKMKSALIYRHFNDTYKIRCLIDRNITRKFNINVGKRERLDETQVDTTDFKFNFDILKSDSSPLTGLIYVGEKMNFDLSLHTTSKLIKTSPQDCYATRLDGTGRYNLIKDRCAGDDPTVQITSSSQDALKFSWEMSAFRYFGNSDGIIITCHFLVCRNLPFGELSNECLRCGQTSKRRKRRDAEDDDNVLGDQSVRSIPIFIAERSNKTPEKKSSPKETKGSLSTVKTSAIVGVACVIGVLLCALFVNKIFFKGKNTTRKEKSIEIYAQKSAAT